MSTNPTVINLVDTETVKVTGDNNNPRNTTFDVPPASATTLGSMQTAGDLMGTGNNPQVGGIMGTQIEAAPSEDRQVPYYSVSSDVADAGFSLASIKFDHLVGGVDARTTASETITQHSFGKCVTFSDVSPAAPIAVSLDSANMTDHFLCSVQNQSSQTVTFTPTSGDINDGAGAASTKTLAAGTSCELYRTSGGSPVVDHWHMLKGAGSGGGGSSPLTTKADIYTHDSSADARLAVGSNGQILTADSTQTTGLKWADAPVTSVAGHTGAVTLAESDVTGLTTDLAAKAPTSRNINTTAPLAGGGDLSADRTLTVSVATSSNVGVVKPDNSTITVDGSGVLTAAAIAPGVITAYGIKGPCFWLKADALTGYSSGDVVTQWADFSGYNLEAYVARLVSTPATNTPKYITNVVNSLPVIRFNGSGWYELSLPVNTASWSIYFVLNFTALTNAYSGVLGQYWNADAGGLFVKSNGKTALYWATSVYDGTGSQTLSTGTWYVLSYHFSPRVTNTYVNTTLDAGPFTQATPNTLSQCWLGNQNVSGRVFKGDIAEVLMFPRQNSSTELSTIVSGLRTKYGF